MFSYLKYFALLVNMVSISVIGNGRSGYFSVIKENHRLNVRILGEYSLQSTVDCFLRCLNENQCKSVNVMNDIEANNTVGEILVGGVFLIRHSGGRCITLDERTNDFMLSIKCKDYFSRTSRASLFHMKSGKCMGRQGTSQLKPADVCDEYTIFSFTSKPVTRLVQEKTRKCVRPRYPNPREGRRITVHSACDSTKKYHFTIEEKNFIKCQLLASTKKANANSHFVPDLYWNHYEPI